jgi:hypothetical protein
VLRLVPSGDAEYITFGASLETKIGNGRMNKARIVRLKTMPPDQKIEKGDGVSKMGTEIRPTFVRHVLEMADIGEHRKRGFNDHAHIPLAALTETQVGRLPVDFVKARVGKEQHLILQVIDQMLEGRTIIDVGSAYALVSAAMLDQTMIPARIGAQSSPTPIVRDHRTPTRPNTIVVVPPRVTDTGQADATTQPPPAPSFGQPFPDYLRLQPDLLAHLLHSSLRSEGNSEEFVQSSSGFDSV